MAKTLTPDGSVERTFVSFPIMKFEANEDGDLVVYGKATDGSVDSDEQIVDPKWSGPALQKWLDTGGNVRVQHNPSLYPAGKGLTVEETDDGHFVKALVVEPTAKRLVKAGVLQAYSVGIARPQVERDITGKARGGIIKGGELFELSLVDRPANKNCSITLSKSEAELTKSDDGEDRTEWTSGDLTGALEAVEITKSESNEELAAAYLAERAAWLAEEPNPASATQGPEYIAKRAEWRSWLAKGEEAGLGEGGHAAWRVKRQMDPNVGGGTDRDSIPAADFAGRNRSFPIVKPGDVSDAASSIGRAGADNYSSDQIKANIIRIANRKGPSFVAQLPDSWRAGDAIKGKKKDKAKKPAFVIGADLGHGRSAEIPIHHKGDDGDSACECCGQSPCTCPDSCDCKAASKAEFMEGEGSDADLGEGGTSMKGVLVKCMCGNCGKDMEEDDLFCSQCGTAASDQGDGQAGAGPISEGYTPEATAAKSLMPTRAAKDGKKSKKGKKGFLPPAGRHREPDGDTTVEQLESDAGMATKPDPKKDKVPASVDAKAKKGRVDLSGDYALKRMHDALCSAYHPDDVREEYPSFKSVADALQVDWFQRRATEAVQKGDFEQVQLMGMLAAEAVEIKAADPAKLADARFDLHKSFTDQYPNTRIKPGKPPTPGSFTRPYVSEGHAPLTSTGAKPKLPAGGRSLDPDNFDRGALTAGHERPSPSNKGDNNPIESVHTGSGRDLYGAASRAYEANRMKAMHDHIEMTTTGLCPMAPSGQVMPAQNGANNMPAPQAPLNTTAGAAPSTKSFDEDALADLIDKRVRKATKAMKKSYESEIESLKADLDELGRQPDPTQAPVRGVVRKTAAGGTAAPVERRSLAIEAQEKAAQVEKAAYIEYLRGLADSGDPEMREKAYKALSTQGVSDPF